MTGTSPSPARPATRILVTGFGPFGEHATNPSAELARSLGRAPGRVGAVLPVSYAAAAERVDALVATHRPEVWLVLGLCADARGMRLERTARNRDESGAPDADGVVRSGLPIVASGPASMPSGLPLDLLAQRIERVGVAVEWSDDAGGFLCNHVFYRARRALADARTDEAACGLVHVPPFDVVARDRQLAALEACIAVVADAKDLANP